MQENLRLGRLVSFAGNKSIPVLRLYRFKEAFSLALVNYFLDEFKATSEDVIFDPFAGMVTTLFGAMLRRMRSVGIEKLPIGAFAAQTLPKFLLVEPSSIATTLEKLGKSIDTFRPATFADDVKIMSLAFKAPALRRLQQ